MVTVAVAFPELEWQYRLGSGKIFVFKKYDRQRSRLCLRFRRCPLDWVSEFAEKLFGNLVYKTKSILA